MLDIDMGLGLITGQGSDPEVMMRYSDDGLNTWSSERTRSFGKIGKYGQRKPVWRRNGNSRERVYEFAISDPVPVRINGAYIEPRTGKT